jgi:putative cell wall-binding protein
LALGRHSGDNRYETAVEISKAGWAEGSEAVILARGDNFADALAGVPLAHKFMAPVLLTRPKALPEATLAEIQRLGASQVYILGKEGAVSAAIETQLADLGLAVLRIGGDNRYDTAAKIARELTPGGTGTAFVVYGQNFPDALAAASYAAAGGHPILLTGTDTLHQLTAQALEDLGVENTFVVGGTGVISNSVMAELPNPERIAGKNRYLTALALAERFASSSHMFIATGTDESGGADAIAGGALAASQGTGILLVSNIVPAEVLEFLGMNVERAEVFGGSAAVSSEVAQAIQDALYVPADDEEPSTPPVTVIPVDAINVSPATMTLAVGETGTIAVTVSPVNATNRQVNWTSGNEAVATVDENGRVTAAGKGIVTITAISAADNSKKASCAVTVTDNWADLADITWYNETNTSFTISTANQLAGLAVLVNREVSPDSFSGKTITLGADIDLLNLEWTPIGNGIRSGYTVVGNSFQGNIVGNGKTISNLKITAADAIGGDEHGFGLIGSMTKGQVNNLTISNPQISGTGCANGAVVGFLSYGYALDSTDFIAVENCNVVGGSVKGLEAAGGIIGRLVGSKDSSDNEAELRVRVVNCKNQGTAVEVTSNNAAGGIVGNQYRTNNLEQVLIKGCANSGNVTSPHMAGGIAGQIANGTLDGGTNTGTISGGYTTDKGFYNGGHLIGYSTGAKIRNVTELFDLKNVLETAGGMPIYIELTGNITATAYRGETSAGASIDPNSITMKNGRFLDISGETIFTVAGGKTINLYTGNNNTVRGETGAALTIVGDGRVNIGLEPTGLKHFFTDSAGTIAAADENGNVTQGKYGFVLKSGDNTNRNQEIWTLVSGS